MPENAGRLAGLPSRMRNVAAPTPPALAAATASPRSGGRGLWRWALLAVGLGGLCVLLFEVGPGAVLRSFGALSWRLPLLFVFPAGIGIAFEALSWRYSFARDTVPFREILRARLAGDAFNGLTPTGGVGGEPLKAWMIRPWSRLRESVPSLLINKTADLVAQALVQIAGIAVAIAILPLDSWLVRAMTAVFALEVVAVAGFVAVQSSGALTRGGSLLGRLRGVTPAAGRLAAARADLTLALYYRRHAARFLAATACCGVALATAILETQLILFFLGSDARLTAAVTLTACALAANFAGFLVPGQLGVQESGFVAGAAALGLPAEVGLTLSLVKRARDLVWYGIGFALFAALRGARTGEARA